MSNLLIILLFSTILYYLSFVGLTFSEFKKSKVVLPFMSVLILPFYILKEAFKTNYSKTKNIFEALKTIPLYAIYLVIFAEVVYFTLDSDTIVGLNHKLNYKSVFNPKVQNKFSVLLKDYMTVNV